VQNKDENSIATQPQLQVELWPVEKLKPYPGNPRINDNAVDAVATSIKTFGFRVPIIVDRDGVIIAGHTRLKAAQKLGLSQVPVHMAADLDDAAAKALRLADNKTAEHASWDLDLLPVELRDLQGLDWNLLDLGFSEDELAKLLDDAEPFEGQTNPDEIPDIPEDAVSKSGEIYTLGRHKLLCGSATNKEDMLRLMGDDRADLWLVDPPYNVSYTGKTKDALTIENDHMQDEEFLQFLTDACTVANDFMREGAAFYIWHADSEGYNFRSAVKLTGWKLRQCLVWAKQHMVIGRQDYHWKHEPCLYGWKDGAAHYWGSDRCQTTVLEFDRPSRSTDHPTMKPVALFAYQIKNSCRPDGIVLDSFCGSGTTVLACEQTGRTARAVELDPKYCDVIRRRWAQFVHGEDCDWEKLTPILQAE